MDCLKKTKNWQHAGGVNLFRTHLRELLGSGLTRETIAAARIYTETDSEKTQRLLNWNRSAESLGTCLVFPYLQLNGEFNGYAKLKPDNLRTTNGKPQKYEAPVGISSKPYVTPAALHAIRDMLGVMFTEGEKKALAASQAGFPCIGLSGPFGWTTKRTSKTEPRMLSDELAAIDWHGRSVTITFDTDPRRNFSVNHGLAELARVLTDHGAIVSILWLPVGERDEDGIPVKQGIDDFIVRHGEQAFRDFIESHRATKTTCSLGEYREQLSISRVESIGTRTAYLDRSPVGSGKSYADMPACKSAGTSLTIQPTHKNCQETETNYAAYGLDAVAYPSLNKDTCQNFDEALLAVESGLSASQAVCLTCKWRDGCDYHDILSRAENSPHRIATHARALSSVEQLAEGRQYVSIHEDSANLLRPKFEVPVVGQFKTVAELADTARQNAGETFSKTDHDTIQHYFWRMKQAASELIQSFDIEDTTPIDLPIAAGSPPGVDARLFQAMKQSNASPSGDAMRLVKAIAAGDIAELVLRVDRIRIRGKKDEFETRKAIVGFTQTRLPQKATIWLNDATADRRETEILAGRTIVDATPAGSLDQQHPAIQIATDIKQSTSRSKLVGILRAVLTAIPNEYQRIGVICDQRHKAAIEGTSKHGPNLEAEYRKRIAKVEHFRSGSSRGSNEWHTSCDLLIVAGTPRVPPLVIKNRLLQLGEIKAACRSEDWVAWGRDHWSGIAQSGRRVTVTGTAYRDRDWQAAYRAIVASELTQSIGRGRGICDNGISVLVLSNEPLDLPLLDFEVKPLTESESEIFNELMKHFPKGLAGINEDSELVKQLPKGLGPELVKQLPINILGKCFTSTSDVAKSIGKTVQHVNKVLAKLAERGLVRRIGERGGWIPTDPPTISLQGAAAAGHVHTEI